MIRKPHVIRVITFLAMGALAAITLFIMPGQIQAAPVMSEAYPDFEAGILQYAHLVELEEGLLLKSENFEIRGSFAEKMLSQLPQGLQAELKKNMLLLLNQEVLESIIRHDAASMGITIKRMDDESLQPYVDRVTQGATITDQAAKKFYDENQAMVGGIPFSQLKDSIKEMLLQQKKQETLESRIMKVAKGCHMQLNRDWVRQKVAAARDNPLDRARMSGKPTLAQFSSAGCPPCQMMKPILAKIKQAYGSAVNVVVIPAGENPMLARRFGVQAVPVQVFFDKAGKTVYQHTGFLSEPDIIKQLKKMGVAS